MDCKWIILHTASQVMYDYGEYLWFQGITPIYHRHHHHRGRHPHRHRPAQFPKQVAGRRLQRVLLQACSWIATSMASIPAIF